MKYLITNNKNVVLGPMDWRINSFQSEMDDLEVEYQVSPNEGYYQVNDQVEVFPITSSTTPAYDANYQQLAGPFYTFDNQEASETYEVVNLTVYESQNKLKAFINTESTKAKSVKTSVEIQGKTVTISSAEFSNYVHQLSVMGDSINWKFPEGWLVLGKVNLEMIVATINGVVQGALDAEYAQHLTIEAADSIASLQALGIAAQAVVPNLGV